MPLEEVGPIGGYDAAILGSAVYAGHWLKPAKELVACLAGDLSDRPVWLFSSGPMGEPPKPEEDPVDVARSSSPHMPGTTAFSPARSRRND